MERRERDAANGSRRGKRQPASGEKLGRGGAAGG